MFDANHVDVTDIFSNVLWTQNQNRHTLKIVIELDQAVWCLCDDALYSQHSIHSMNFTTTMWIYMHWARITQTQTVKRLNVYDALARIAKLVLLRICLEIAIVIVIGRDCSELFNTPNDNLQKSIINIRIANECKPQKIHPNPLNNSLSCDEIDLIWYDLLWQFWYSPTVRKAMNYAAVAVWLAESMNMISVLRTTYMDNEYNG